MRFFIDGLRWQQWWLLSVVLLPALLSWTTAAFSQTDSPDTERYLRQAQDGHVQSQAYVAYLYYAGEGLPQNYEEAVRWFRMAAEQGHIDAQYNIGVMYTRGHGVPADPVAATRWYKLAAEQGHAPAMHQFGLACLLGNGTVKDIECARGWLQKAAETGHAEAQIQLAGLYLRDGDDQSMKQAARWYRRAADQGNAVAQHHLALLYHHGSGIEKSSTQTIFWLQKAQAQGYEPSAEWLQRLQPENSGRETQASFLPAAGVANVLSADEQENPASPVVDDAVGMAAEIPAAESEPR